MKLNLNDHLTWLDLVLILILAAVIFGSCGVRERTIIVEDWSWHLPKPGSTIDRLTYVGWKGEI